MSSIKKIEPKDRPILKKGDKGEWIVFLQDALNGCKGKPLNLDGDFGNNTENEVRRFQQEVGLTVNGIVDASTWTALEQHEKLFGWQCEWPTNSLSLTGIGGVDTFLNVEASMVPEASTYMGTSPRFWGRYFQGNTKDGEYLHASENKPLHEQGIRVLPISRQTDKVNGDEQDGHGIGSSHAKDVIETFGEDYLASQGDSFYFFLDVEGIDGQPSMSKEFYLGWSKAVVNASSKVKLLPCVYLSAQKDPTSKHNLSAAMKEGAQCHGLWVANYFKNDPKIHSWNRDLVKPATPVPCKVLIWQYAGDIPKSSEIFDFNQINPFLDNPELVLRRFILPPT